MTDDSPGDVTAALLEWSRGNPAALSSLMPCVYDQLRQLASRRLRSERPDHTLQTTALVHEVYLKLVDQRHAFAAFEQLGASSARVRSSIAAPRRATSVFRRALML